MKLEVDLATKPPIASGGRVAVEIEPTVKGMPEPEHPAPVLTLTKARRTSG